jgi:ferredoxin/flavodoxin---NADP+ reductase
MTSVSESDIYDITIIGAGPTGLYGLYYTSMRSMKAKVIDSLPQVGGQLMALYSEKYIYDVPGFRKVLAKDLIRNLEDQAFQANPTLCVSEKIVDLAKGDDSIFRLTSEAGNVHLSKTVVIAAGVGAFMPRKLDVPKIDELEGRGVYYFVRNLEEFRGKRVLVVGGGDSAIDWAHAIQPIAKQVTLIHKFDRFQAHEQSVEDLKKTPVEIRVLNELKAIHGDEHVEGVTIFHNVTGDEEERDVDILLLCIGFITNLGPIKNWGLELHKNAIAVNPQMATNMPGVFAAGDICTHPGHLKLIAVGAGEAAIAVNNAKNYIDPTARVEPGHSSHKKQ